jgi:hypothetical protein
MSFINYFKYQANINNTTGKESLTSIEPVCCSAVHQQQYRTGDRVARVVDFCRLLLYPLPEESQLWQQVVAESFAVACLLQELCRLVARLLLYRNDDRADHAADLRQRFHLQLFAAVVVPVARLLLRVLLPELKKRNCLLPYHYCTRQQCLQQIRRVMIDTISYRMLLGKIRNKSTMHTPCFTLSSTAGYFLPSTCLRPMIQNNNEPINGNSNTKSTHTILLTGFIKLLRMISMSAAKGTNSIIKRMKSSCVPITPMSVMVMCLYFIKISC